METKTIEVPVAAATFDLGSHLGKFIAAVKQAVADGWQPGADLPAVISSAVEELVPAVADLQKLGDEVADKQAFANALFLSLSPVVFGFIEKK
jgi:hypothetical protein